MQEKDGMMTIDRLQSIIEDYKGSKITRELAEKSLSFLTYEEDRKYNRTCRWYLKLFHGEPIEKSAEDEYIEEWRMKRIRELITELLEKNVITREQFQILYNWCVNMKTQAEIAKDLGVSQQAIAKRIHKVQEKAAKCFDINMIRSVLHNVTISIPMSHRNTGSTKVKIRMPSEFAMHINNGIKRKSNGEYRILTKCVLPEMLQRCFGDSKTCCGYCYDDFGETVCTRKEANAG
jgi:predicted DNA-binding protein YlxM (UPF0122 family)